MWSEQPFESLLKERLASLPEPQGTDLFADYVAARRFVIEQIAGLIPTAEPDLTDHSAAHLADVMSRALDLLGGRTSEYLEPLELYLLGVSILFHDTGNLHGRIDHGKKIGRIYNACRHEEARFNMERHAVLSIAGAHTGSTKEGSKDTLREVLPFSFRGRSIRGREVAAVLRLADELAEGPHRTSAYMLNHGGYKPASEIFHWYASAAEYSVDTDRIALSYTVNINRGTAGLHLSKDLALDEFLRFCYSRIAKVDEERRYCKHYCNLLSRLKETGAWFGFWFQGNRVPDDLEPLSLSDLTVPGEGRKNIVELNASYEPLKLLPKLETECGGRG